MMALHRPLQQRTFTPTCLKEKEDNEHLFNAGSIDNDDEHNMKK
jgi:hypothetical protein